MPGHRMTATSSFSRVSLVRPVALAALLSQEPLDLRDQLVARRQASLIDHRLEPLDVRTRRLVGGGREVKPLAELPRFLFEIARRERHAEVARQHIEQLERRRRVRP